MNNIDFNNPPPVKQTIYMDDFSIEGIQRFLKSNPPGTFEKLR